jgi:predicted dehydrogenase
VKSDVRFGLVGTNAAARAYAHAILAARGAELVGVADADGASGESFADALNAPWYGSCDALIEQGAPHALVICTSVATHPPLTAAAARTGIHVLCDGPFAPDTATAAAMLEAAQQAGTTLLMTTKFRHAADVERARNILRLGFLGEIVVVASEFNAVLDLAHRSRSGGVLLDSGADALDLLRYLLGPLESLSAAEGSRPQGAGVEETVQMFTRSREGTYATAELSWSEGPRSPFYVQVAGTRGRISLGWRESLYRPEGDESWKSFGAGYDESAVLAAQLDDFMGAMRGTRGRADGADALASVAGIEAAYASLLRDRWVAIGERGDPVADEVAFA